MSLVTHAANKYFVQEDCNRVAGMLRKQLKSIEPETPDESELSDDAYSSSMSIYYLLPEIVDELRKCGRLIPEKLAAAAEEVRECTIF